MQTKRFLLALILFVVCAAISCDTSSGIKKSKNSDLEIIPTKIDFGNIAVGIQKFFNIQIKNVGTGVATLKLLKLETASIFTLYQGAIAAPTTVKLQPNDIFTVVIEFNPTAVESYSDKLLITSDNSKASDIEDEFKVSGNGVNTGWLEIDPYPVVNYNSVVVGQTVKTESITLENIGKDKLTISGITLIDGASGQYKNIVVKDSASAVLNPPYDCIEIAINSQITIDIDFDPATEGIKHGKLEIKHDSGGNAEVAEVELYGIGIKPLGVLPKIVYFRNYDRRNYTFSKNPRANTLADRTFELLLTNHSASAIQISNATISNAGASHFRVQALPFSIAGNSTELARILYNPTDVGLHEAVLEISYTNNGNNFNKDIPIIARATGELSGSHVNPCIGLAGLPIPVNIPTTVSAKNDSSNVIQIQAQSDISITLGVTDFSISSIADRNNNTISTFPHSIQPGDSVNVNINYAAGSTIRSVSGMLEIAYQSGGSAGAASPLKLPLTGYTGEIFKYEIFDTFAGTPSGWSSTGDWEFGTPDSASVGGPDSDHTPATIPMLKENAYGTKLAGRYSANQTYDNNYLEVKNLDFTNHQPFMLFFQWLELGNGDYAQIQASADNGNTWKVVKPLFPAYNQVEEYSGTIAGGAWEPALVDLTAFAGESNVTIRWALKSDGSGEDCGWYIDDMLLFDVPAIFGDMLVTPHQSFHVPADADGITFAWLSYGANKFNVYFDDVDGSKLYKSNTVVPWVTTPPLTKGKQYFYMVEVVGGVNTSQSAVYSFMTSTETYENPGILINEINTSGNANQRYVEIYNPTQKSVDISGWIILTKDYDSFPQTDEPDGVHLFEDGRFLAPGELISVGEKGATGLAEEIFDGTFHWIKGDGSVEVNLMNSKMHSIDYFIANVVMLELNSGIRLYTPGAKWDVTASFTGTVLKDNLFRLNSNDTDAAKDWGSRSGTDKDQNVKNPGQ